MRLQKTYGNEVKDRNSRKEKETTKKKKNPNGNFRIKKHNK